jgi:hypothetical protein
VNSRPVSKPRKRSRVVRWPGLCEAATELGVHRTHLYLVLTKQRTSHRLTARFHDWQQRRAS